MLVSHLIVLQLLFQMLSVEWDERSANLFCESDSHLGIHAFAFAVYGIWKLIFETMYKTAQVDVIYNAYLLW